MNDRALSDLRAPELRAIVLGGSAGGIEAVGTLLGALPTRLGVPVLVALHIKAGSNAHWPLVFRGSRAPVYSKPAKVMSQGSGSRMGVKFTRPRSCSRMLCCMTTYSGTSICLRYSPLTATWVPSRLYTLPVFTP